MTGKPSPRGTTPPIHTTGSSHSSLSRAMVHKRGYTHRSCVAAFPGTHHLQKKNEERTNIIIEEEEEKKKKCINYEIMMNVQP